LKNEIAIQNTISGYTGRETGEEIAAIFTKVIQEQIPSYDVTHPDYAGRKSYMVTDGARNICKAARTAKLVVNCPMKCVDHTLQLVLKEAIEKNMGCKLVQMAINEAKALASKIHMSGATNNLLRLEAATLDGNYYI